MYSSRIKLSPYSNASLIGHIVKVLFHVADGLFQRVPGDCQVHL